MTSGGAGSCEGEHGIEGDAIGFESSDKGASAAAQGEASGGHRVYLTGGHEARDKGNKRVHEAT